jgi:hypothetical protein
MLVSSPPPLFFSYIICNLYYFRFALQSRTMMLRNEMWLPRCTATVFCKSYGTIGRVLVLIRCMHAWDTVRLECLISLSSLGSLGRQCLLRCFLNFILHCRFMYFPNFSVDRISSACKCFVNFITADWNPETLPSLETKIYIGRDSDIFCRPSEPSICMHHYVRGRSRL